MSLGSFLGLTVTDPALAGFSVSGAAAGTGSRSAAEAGRDSGGQDSGAAYGLLPPERELEPSAPGTGLTAPEDEATPGRGAADELSYIQHVVQALGGDPRHFRFADGLGGAGTDGVRLIPVGGGGGARAPLAEGAPLELSVNPRAASAFDALSNINPDLDNIGTAFDFEFGSSRSSLEKTQALASIAGKSS